MSVFFNQTYRFKCYITNLLLSDDITNSLFSDDIYNDMLGCGSMTSGSKSVTSLLENNESFEIISTSPLH